MWQSPLPPPELEQARLAALDRCGIMDSLPDPRFDRITRLAQRFYGADAAFIGFIDGGMQWMKSRTSEEIVRQVPRSETVCTLVIATGEELVIDDLQSSPMLSGHAVLASPWRFYAGVPLLADGSAAIGTLCILRREPGRPGEFRTDALHDLASITLDQIDLARHNAELQALSNTDKLTGVGNRRMFDDELDRACRRARRTGEPASLILVDLDHFKQINDAEGHQAGDAALVAVASVLQRSARRSDDIVVRYGGEEFAVILSGVDPVGALQKAESIRRQLVEVGIRHPTSPDGWLTASLGAATLRENEAPASLVRRADRALYAAKSAGRNRSLGAEHLAESASPA